MSAPTRHCRNCGQLLPERASGKRQTICSALCAMTGRYERRGPDDCWPWIKPTHSAGYGHFSFMGELMFAHRVVLAARESIKEGNVVRHKCDNPPCCNPAHLVQGSQADNNHDRMQRGRSVTIARTGSAHVRAKLSDESVQEIRSAQGLLSSRELGRLHGVSKTAILRIWRGSTWKRVSGIHRHTY